jgi:hypothetical protein
MLNFETRKTENGNFETVLSCPPNSYSPPQVVVTLRGPVGGFLTETLAANAAREYLVLAGQDSIAWR